MIKKNWSRLPCKISIGVFAILTSAFAEVIWVDRTRKYGELCQNLRVYIDSRAMTGVTKRIELCNCRCFVAKLGHVIYLFSGMHEQNRIQTLNLKNAKFPHTT